jgi:hypothetical protein
MKFILDIVLDNLLKKRQGIKRDFIIVSSSDFLYNITLIIEFTGRNKRVMIEKKPGALI